MKISQTLSAALTLVLALYTAGYVHAQPADEVEIAREVPLEPAPAPIVIKNEIIRPDHPLVGDDGILDMPGEAGVLDGCTLDRVCVRVWGKVAIRNSRFVGYRTDGPTHPLFVLRSQGSTFERLTFDGTNRGVIIQPRQGIVSENTFTQIDVRNIRHGHNGMEAFLIEGDSHPFENNAVEGLRVSDSDGGGVVFWKAMVRGNEFIDVRLYDGRSFVSREGEVMGNEFADLEIVGGTLSVDEHFADNTVSGWRSPGSPRAGQSNLTKPGTRRFWIPRRASDEPPVQGRERNDMAEFVEIADPMADRIEAVENAKLRATVEVTRETD